MRRMLLAGLVLLLAAGCSGDAGQATSGEAWGEGDAAPADPPRVETQTDTRAADAADNDAVADAAAGADIDGVSGGAAALPELPRAAAVERIIKEGTVTVEVAEGDFDAAYARLIEAARRLGGSVMASSSVTDHDGGTRGSVTVRVPSDRWEDLLTGVGRIGDVRARDITSQDVSAEFVDLTARKRHLEAQEAFYLELLDRAAGVADAIAVQQQVEGIQSQIEQIQGRLNWLEDRTSYSTLTVELYELGVPAPTLAEAPEGPSLARYWHSAQAAFINVVGAMLFVVVFLTPIAVPAGITAVVWWAVRRRRLAPTASAMAPAAD